MERIHAGAVCERLYFIVREDTKEEGIAEKQHYGLATIPTPHPSRPLIREEELSETAWKEDEEGLFLTTLLLLKLAIH